MLWYVRPGSRTDYYTYIYIYFAPTYTYESWVVWIAETILTFPSVSYTYVFFLSFFLSLYLFIFFFSFNSSLCFILHIICSLSFLVLFVLFVISSRLSIFLFAACYPTSFTFLTVIRVQMIFILFFFFFFFVNEGKKKCETKGWKRERR